MTDCVIYTRVSSEEQAKVGFSIPFQSARLQEEAEKAKLRVRESFSDVETAKCVGRPGFERMLRWFEEHPEVRTVLVHRIDRLIRNHYEYGLVTEQLGIRVHSVVEPAEDSAAGRMLHGVNVVVAKYHSDNLSTEVRKGMWQKFEEGGCITRAPIGYVNIPRTKTRKATIAVDEDKAPLIRHLFERYASGHVSLSVAGLELAELGLRTKHGLPYPKERIRKLLKDVRYIGLARYKKKDATRPGSHEPLIPQALFDQVQQVLVERHRDPGERGSRFFLLRGLTWCAACGRRLAGECHRRGSYYRCMPGGHGHTCTERYTPVQVLDQAVEVLLPTLTLPAEVHEQIEGSLELIVEEHRRTREDHGRALREQERTLHARAQRLQLALADGTMTNEDYRSARDLVATELHGVKARLSVVESDLESDAQLVREILSTASGLATLYQLGDKDERKALLQTVFRRILVRNRQIERIELNPPFDQLLGDGSKDSIVNALVAHVSAKVGASSAAGGRR